MTPRLPFLDALKALGLGLILWGHVAPETVETLVPPVRLKQLGVALFFFVAGFALARETRPTRLVLVRRLGGVLLFAVGFALFVSLYTFLQTSPDRPWNRRLALSNYLPFALGLNAVRDSFPANPTTWFLGTYLHALLAWAVLLRGVPMTGPLLVGAAVFEVATRALLLATAGQFVAYQALPNWTTVFCLGIYCGQRPDPKPAVPWGATLALGLLAVAWPLLVGRLTAEPAPGEDRTFPFMTLSLAPGGLEYGARSLLVSAAYLAFPWLTYRVLQPLPNLPGVAFLARNTTVVFVAHMPLIYALSPVLRRHLGEGWSLYAVKLLLFFPGLALLSEAGRRLLRRQRPSGRSPDDA